MNKGRYLINKKQKHIFEAEGKIKGGAKRMMLTKTCSYSQFVKYCSKTANYLVRFRGKYEALCQSKNL